jgi:hypothetical protein
MGRCEAQFKDQENFAGIPNLLQQTEPIRDQRIQNHS